MKDIKLLPSQGNIPALRPDEGGTGDLLIFPLVGLFLSCLYLYFIKLRLKRTLLQRYHNTITDSTANGKQNIVVFLGFVFFIGLFLVGSLQKSLGLFDDEVMKDLSSGAFSVSYYIFSIIVTFSTSPMFIMNMEFKTFLIRKFGQLFIFNARTYFRSHGFPAQRNEPGRGGKNMKQKFGRRSKVHRTIVPQGYQQQETACNRNNCQVNNFKIRREEQGPRCNQITRPSLMIHVQEAEHSVQNM